MQVLIGQQQNVIRRAESLVDVTNALQLVSREFESLIQSEKEQYRKLRHIQWVEFIFGRVIVKWGPLMSKRQLDDCVKVFLQDEACILTSLLGLQAAVLELSRSEDKSTFALQYAISCLVEILSLEDGSWFTSSLVELSTRSENQNVVFVRQLIGFLSQVADVSLGAVAKNNLMVEKLNCLRTENLFQSCAEGINRFLYLADMEEKKISLHFVDRLRLLQELLPRLCRLGLSEYISNAQLHHMVSHDILAHKEHYEAFWSRIPETAMEPLLFNFLRYLGSSQWLRLSSAEMIIPHTLRVEMLRIALSPLLTREPTTSKSSKQKLDFLIKERFIFVRSLPPPALWALLDIMKTLPIEDDASGDSCLKSFTSRVASIWSNTSVATQMDHEQHMYLTGVLRGCLRRLTAPEIESVSVLLPLVNGVQAHIQSNVIHSQTLGMMVGEEFSDTLNKEFKLNFENLKDGQQRDPFSRDAERLESHPFENIPVEIGDAKHLEAPSAPSSMEDSDDSAKPPQTKRNVWYSSDSDDDDSDDEAEPDLVPMASAAADAATNAQAHSSGAKYLRDCSSSFSSDEFAVVRDTLATFPALVQSTIQTLGVTELEAIAPELVQKLLFLENKFGLPDFANTRIDHLVLLVASAPKPCLGYLHEQMYSRNLAIGSFLDIMQVVVGAAQELSAVKPNLITAAVNAVKEPANATQRPSPIGKVTRIWGRRKGAPRAKRRNEFAAIASLFFAVLFADPVDSDTKTSRAKMLFDTEPMLLARTVLSLGALLECSQNLVNVEQLATRALELAWWARSSQFPDVRRATVYCLAQFIVVVPSAILRSRLAETVDDIVAWLLQTSRQDSDFVCRSHAAAVLQSADLQEVIQNL